MNAILVPIGSTAEAQRAAERVIARYRAEPVDVHLLNVQRPLPRHVARFFPRSELQSFHHDAGMHVLDPAMRALDAAGIPHHDHVVVGHAAEAIVRFAARVGCADVLLEPAEGGLRALFHAGSVGSQVRHLMRAGGDAAV
jgi:nucleotide-binding universal stress UspA family protein